MNSYLVGQVARLSVSFTNSAGQAVDPSSITLYLGIVKPAATPVQSLVYGVGSIVRLSAGVYYSDVPINSPGDWRYRWEGRGDNQAAAEGRFSSPAPEPWPV